MQKLKLTLFGATAAFLNDHPLHFRTDKIRALLVFLALENGRPHERQSLAALFWPEMPEQAALKNLRVSLHRLQQTLDETCPGLSSSLYGVTRQTIQCDPAALEVDVLHFLALLSACETHPHRHLHQCQHCLDRLVEAAALYQGELLSGFGLPDAYPFDEWLLFWRERLQNQAINALGQLAAALAERGETEAALVHAGRQVSLDPFREEAHRLLMRLYTGKGEYGKAAAQYESCRRLLQEELGVSPAQETTALFRQIQAEIRGEPQGLHAPRQPAALHHFPVEFTTFVGREAELRRIEAWFLDPKARLLTLMGPGGIGKTRLAVHAASQLAGKAGAIEGIYFFPLAAVRSAEALLTSLLNGLGAESSARSTLQESLFNHLRERNCLLVLDNFDQLADSASLLKELLAAAPGVRLLVVSQVLLNLRGEHQLLIGGLDYPADGEEAADPAAYSAVQLFAETARQSDVSFQINAENLPAILEICRLVEGHPLALELAAAWVRIMDCGSIAREIGRNLDFLSETSRDRIGQHQSMAAVFANSWQLLPTAEQNVLAELSVFRGPFTLDSAMAITRATPLSVARLLDRSLLQRRKDGRYELHELLRQFVQKQADGRAEEAARQHCDFYLDLVVSRENAFYGPQPRQAVAAVQRDLTNVRQAWRWAIQQGDWHAVERSLESVGRFYQVAALLQEGLAMFTSAAEGLGDRAPISLWRSYFLSKLGRHAEALQAAEHAREQAAQDGLVLADVESLLGELLPRQGKFDEAKALQVRAIEYFQSASDLHRQARALRRMALTCWRSGDSEEAVRYFQQAIPIHQAIGEKRGLAQLYNVLGGIYYEKNDVVQALACVQEARALYEEIEDRLDAAVVAANSARLYTHLGRFDEALSSNQRAIEISRELDDHPGLARDLSNRGYILSVLGDLERSLDYYFQALAIASERGDAARVADFQAGAAAVYALAGDDASALRYYDLALPVLLEQGVPYHLAGPLLGKAEILVRSGQLSPARSLCEQAQALTQETDLTEFYRQSRVLAARLDYAEGRHDAGLKQLTALLEEAGDESERAAIRYEIWRLTGERSDAESAYEVYRQAAARNPGFIQRKRMEELQAFLQRS